jgi:hypothetical protein
MVQQYRGVPNKRAWRASIHVGLGAIRKLAVEAAENGLLDRSLASSHRFA